MKLNLFNTTGDYEKMLKKIGLFTFTSTLICTILLRESIPAFDAFCAKLDLNLNVKVFEIEIPLVTIAISLAIAIVFRMFKFHDRVSDLFGIRKQFDITEIIYPLAMLSGATITGSKLNYIQQNRKEMMDNIFYKYASSKLPTPPIDKHLIEQAMDQWSWFWIITESLFPILITAATVLFAKNYLKACILLIIGIVLLLFLLPIRRLCVRNAIGQVKAITQQEERKIEVREYFNAL